MESDNSFLVLYAVKISYIKRKGKRKKKEWHWMKRTE